jgi:hypothetical protein
MTEHERDIRWSVRYITADGLISDSWIDLPVGVYPMAELVRPVAPGVRVHGSDEFTPLECRRYVVRDIEVLSRRCTYEEVLA